MSSDMTAVNQKKISKLKKESFAVFLYKWYDVWTNIFIQCTVPIFVTVAMMMGKLWEQNSDHACHWNYEVVFSSFFTELSYTVSHNIKLNQWLKMKIIWTITSAVLQTIFFVIQTHKNLSNFNNNKQLAVFFFFIEW